jgi:MFS family permease
MVRMRTNIQLLYVYMFLNRLEMWLPIIVLFVQERGFSLTQYTILDAVWYASTLLFEIPTGVITDRYGRKISLLVAVLVQSFSLFIVAYAHTFSAMFIAYVLWGFGSSFETGTHDAIIYDTLDQINRASDYRKVRGRMASLAILAGALGSVLAGYLGGIQLALPIILTASIALLMFPLLLFLNEPEVTQSMEPSHLLHLKRSIHYLSNNRLVSLLILYSAFMVTAVWGLYDFYQPFLGSFGIGVEAIGLLYLFFRLFGVAGAQFSDSIFRAIGKYSIYLIPLCFSVSVLCMGFFNNPLVIAVIFLIFFLDGVRFPIINDLINQNLPSSRRATIISLGSVLSCLMGCIVYPALGRIADVLSLQMTFRVLGFGLCVVMSMVLLFLRREDQL